MRGIAYFIYKNIKILFLTLFIFIISYSCREKNYSAKKYINYIGYLDPNTTISSTSFALCGTGKIEGTHHGLPKLAYKPNKGIFDKTIRSKYQNNEYTDSGYLNFRFVINCKGEIGRVEIIQMNIDLEETELNSEMIDQLYQLTSESENWNGYTTKDQKPIDYYMYVSYKIIDGEITEILP
ncbi:hypothetical protein [Aquimarina sediminis]|uniref:hypothetical protein n=1 Tax=Aquimarina sediminis TaxID=2070536 RepID=UPI000CA01D47|nr:hypothetical protein [Aquimarina sediminis]